MTIVFWFCFLLIGWCYVGYPAAMIGRARWARRSGVGDGAGRPRCDDGASNPPRISVVLAVRNEARNLERRLQNLLGQDYPGERIEVVVVCNNCSDDTDAIAHGLSLLDPRIVVLTSPAADGKSGALNLGVLHATGDLIVFADARQRFAPDVFRQLATSFDDPTVGVVSGRLRITGAAAPAVEGVRLYWGMETALRLAEGRTGSVIGATGAIYAIRRRHFEPFPANLILDDVFLPLRIAMKNQRVILNPHAVAHDVSSGSSAHEFSRKVRTMVGNLQLLRFIPSLLSPRRNPMWIRYVSHKLLRVLSPFLFLAMLTTAFVAGGWFYGGVAWALLGAYTLGLLGLLAPIRALAVPSAFVLVHAAVFVAVSRMREDAAAIWVPPVSLPVRRSARASAIVPFAAVRPRVDAAAVSSADGKEGGSSVTRVAATG
jgi:poly-beta-1,6-N-acetyl-D-glucosamine synthase